MTSLAVNAPAEYTAAIVPLLCTQLLRELNVLGAGDLDLVYNPILSRPFWGDDCS